MVDCFYFFTSTTTPAHPINTQCNNQPVVYIFLPFGRGKGSKQSTCYFYFSILEGEMGKCHDDCLSQEAKTLEKQNSMLSFLTYIYQKTKLKKYLTQNGIYIWLNNIWSIASRKDFFKTQSSYNVWSWERKNFLPGTDSMYGV